MHAQESSSISLRLSGKEWAIPDWGISSQVEQSWTPHSFLSQSPITSPQSPITSSTCPADVNTLTSQLLKDLPSYANRVIQRARRLNRTVDSYSYVLVAGNT
ncbi:MAG: hypothetical protein F6K28_41395, partial [Microcoleus sp. SIO2G3]|nr:hypothetical protein [Microcoleus sp. SIO2G3]